MRARTEGRKELEGLSVQDLLAAYACMRLSREIDKMETLLHRSGNLWFSIAGAGKEALNVATGMHLRADDIKLPYYRDHALALWSRHHPARHAAPGHGSAASTRCRVGGR